MVVCIGQSQSPSFISLPLSLFFLVTIKVCFRHLWLHFCSENKLICTFFFFFWDSTYKQYMIFVILWLNSLSMTVSRFIDVSANGIMKWENDCISPCSMSLLFSYVECFQNSGCVRGTPVGGRDAAVVTVSKALPQGSCPAHGEQWTSVRKVPRRNSKQRMNRECHLVMGMAPKLGGQEVPGWEGDI